MKWITIDYTPGAKSIKLPKLPSAVNSADELGTDPLNATVALRRNLDPSQLIFRSLVVGAPFLVQP